MKQVSFPGLGLSFDLNPVAFYLFPGKPIYWYAIIIATGFLLACYYAMRRADKLETEKDDILDALVWVFPASVVCARIYYVMFNFDLYIDNPVSMLYIWEGGIAIYGAVIGAVLTLAVYCKIRRKSLPRLLDIAVLGLLIGQCVGRWGNFVNGEAYGSPTSLPWRMVIYDYDTLTRVVAHPTFLYESLWNLLGFILLHLRSKHRRFAGELFLLYVAWYGFGRSIIEGLRTDSLYLFNTGIRVSQLVGAISSIVSLIVLCYFYKKNKTSVEDEYNAGTDN